MWDYSVSIAGGIAAAQLITEYGVGNSIRLSSMRRAYTRRPYRQPI